MARRERIDLLPRAPQVDVFVGLDRLVDMFEFVSFFGAPEDFNLKSLGFPTLIISRAIENQRAQLLRMRDAGSSNGFMLMITREWMMRKYNPTVNVEIGSIGS